MIKTNNTNRKMKVLIVDDSLFVRKLMEKVIQSFSNMHVVALARNGEEALEILKKREIDLIFMDLLMPKMGGIKTLQIISKNMPIPTVILTALEKEENKELFEEIKHLGALGIVTKPNGINSLYIENLQKKIEEFFLGSNIQFEKLKRLKKINTIQDEINIKKDQIKGANKTYTKSKIRNIKENHNNNIVNNKINFTPNYNNNSKTTNVTPKIEAFKKEVGISNKAGLRKINPAKDYLLVFGASAGGPSALCEIFSALPLMQNLFIVVVQHMPATFTFSFAERLNNLSPYIVKEVEHNEIPMEGCAYVARGDFHLSLSNHPNLHFVLEKSPKINYVRPSVDFFIETAIPIFKERIMGVILTGIGSDGAIQMLNIKKNGGITIAQDKNSAQVWGMPKKAIELNAIDYVGNLNEIPKIIYDLYKKREMN
ncbi:MAG: chemotaxis protein CheB [Promethearchaeota archaeon]